MRREARLSMVAPDKPKAPPRDPRGRIEELRRQLLTAAVKFVEEGPRRSRAELLRDASELSGIKIGLIEAELKEREPK